jgi:hypothetical protein
METHPQGVESLVLLHGVVDIFGNERIVGTVSLLLLFALAFGIAIWLVRGRC